MSSHSIALTVNGERKSLVLDSRKTLADVLREDLGLVGTKLGCEHGVCGACTILLDGEAVRACLLLGVQADGAEIVTIEGLAEGDELTDVQRAFHENSALQCGFCTPGFVISVTALLESLAGTRPSEEEIRRELGGNICRCTGYHGAVAAVKELLDARAERAE